VTIHDRDTLVISGLRMIRVTTRESKIPGLGDLPMVGNLFKNHRDQQQLTDLYFFLTPTLLEDAGGGHGGPPAPVYATVPTE
jgi:type II secretory pathway component GspD/PulD (secretin)